MGKARVVKKPASPVKISTSLFQRTSKNSLAAATTTRVTNNSLAAAASSAPPAPPRKSNKAQARGKLKSNSKAPAKKAPPVKGKVLKGRVTKTSTSLRTNVSKSPAKVDKSSTRSSGTTNEKTPASKKQSAPHTTTTKTTVKGSEKKGAGSGVKAVKGKSQESSQAVSKVVAAKPLSRRTSSVSSRRNSTPAAPPVVPKTRGRKESIEKSSSPTRRDGAHSDKSKSPSPRPRVRNQSSSSSTNLKTRSSSSDLERKVTTRKRSQSGSLSFGSSPPSSPLSPSSSSSSSSSAPSSSAPTSKNKKHKLKNVPKVVATFRGRNAREKAGTKLKTKSDNNKFSGSKQTSEGAKQKPVTDQKLKSSLSSGSKGKVTKATPKTTISKIEKPGESKIKGRSVGKKVDTSKSDDRAMAKKIAKKAIKAKAKPKPKLRMRPKSKKRMASLNAKAILEASFSFEPMEKRAKVSSSPKVTPTKASPRQVSPTHSQQPKQVPLEIKDFENLLTDVKIELRSGPPPSHAITGGIVPEKPAKVERKRKSGSHVVVPPSAGGGESATVTSVSVGTETATSTPLKSPRRHSDEKSNKDKSKAERQSRCSSKSKSPVPKKKAKVATAECSTSTPAWNWDPCLPSYPLQGASALPYDVAEEKLKQQSYIIPEAPVTPTQHRQQADILQSHAYYGSGRVGLDQHSAFRHKGQACQLKEIKSMSAHPPVPQFGPGTVYQPAGPLIEPHKNPPGSSAGIQLPETVRLPPDLKVTYQTHPPASSPLVTSSSAGGSGGKGAGHGSRTSSTKAKASHSATHSKSTSQSVILHQPYKSAVSSTSSSSTSSRSTQNQQLASQQASSSSSTTNLSLYGSSGTSSTLMGAPLGSTIGQQQHTISSNVTMTAHHPMSASAVSASAAPGMYYPGFLGPHHSPFAPSKYPMVPPDSYRPHSPYPTSFLYTPSTPQPNSGNFYMTPFYTPPMTPTSTPVVGTGGQPRPMLPSQHSSSAAAAAAAAAAYYQSGPASAPPASSHPPSSYFVPTAAGTLASPHHSMQSQSSPGHAGLFHPNQSSHPACPCPMESCPPRNSTSKSTITSNNNKLSQPQQLQQPQCATHAFRSVREPSSSPCQPSNPAPAQQLVSKSCATATANISRRKDFSHPPAPTTPALAADPPKAIQHTNMDSAQAKQLESAKTFTEQYSLPDDITITPILVVAGTTPGVPTTTSSVVSSGTSTGPAASVHSSKTAPHKPKDIVHVINPRSGQTTTIAKHMSNSSNSSQQQSKNVSPVKPNNAGAVGKINPDLDVIVIAPGQRHPREGVAVQGKTQPQSLLKINNTTSSPKKVSTDQRTEKPLSISSVNLVQPLPKVPQSLLTTSHNTSKSPKSRGENTRTETFGKLAIKRKGIHECIDGLQKKKMLLLEEQQSSNKVLINGSDALLAASAVAPTRRKSASPSAARALPRESVFEMRNSTIVNEREAVVAASAVVVPPNGSHFRLSPHKNGMKKGRGWNMGLKDVSSSGSISPKFRESNIKVTTRSSAANAKIKTRSSARDGPCYVSPKQPGRVEGSDPRSRSRLLRRRVNLRQLTDSKSYYGPAKVPSASHHLTISTNGRVKNKSPSMSSPGSGSSSSSGNSQVILRIPKVSGGVGCGSNQAASSFSASGYRSSLVMMRGGMASELAGNRDRLRLPDYSSLGSSISFDRNLVIGESSGKYRAQIAGSMAFNALKKRAIVKPLSPNVMNGALHSMLMARRQPKWSNGWRFEGEPFEAKVYLTNDDQPVIRRCYPAMRHDGGDVIQARDCVLLKSGPRKTDLPFVAKVAALWENPVDGEMMFSLLWYYRPEHTEIGRTREDMPDEIFASKHRDCNSVATIEDRCYVLTLNEYCRYKKRLKQLEEGISANLPLVPLSSSSQANVNSAAEIALAVWCGIQGDQRRVPSPGKVSPEVVFFCRKVYDYRQKRMLKNPS